MAEENTDGYILADETTSVNKTDTTDAQISDTIRVNKGTIPYVVTTEDYFKTALGVIALKPSLEQLQELFFDISVSYSALYRYAEDLQLKLTAIGALADAELVD